MFLDRFIEITWVASAFRGIRIAVGILIVDVGVRMIRKMKKEPLRIAILACAFIAMLLISIFAWNISMIILLLIAAAVSMAVYLAKERQAGKGGEQA